MITVAFKGEDIYARESGLWQHDRGQKLRIEGLDISEVTEIDFSLKSTGGQSIPAVAMPRNGGIEVDIPNSLLAAKEVQSYFIYAFIYLIDGESGETIRRITMDVRARPGRIVEDPEGDPDPFAEAIKEVRDSAARAESAAVTATEAIVAVETKGTEQANIVAAEGAKQLGEIARVMATIPEDYTDLSELAESNYRNKAPGIVETASGAMIEIKDGSDLPLQGMTVYGKSEQVVTTGAQLLDIVHAKQTSGQLDDVREDGFTWTYNGDINDNTRIVNVPCDLKKGETYIFKANTSDKRVSFYLPETMQYLNNSRPFILNDNATKLGVYISISPDNYGTYSVSDLMLNKGETALPFEPYTGGIPAPNPNYPQEIESVGEEIEIEATGRNLIDYKTAVLGGPDSEKKPEFIENGYILGGEPSDRISTYRFNFVKGETYTITFNEKHIHGTEEAIVYLIGTKGMPDQYSIRSGKPFVASHNYEYFCIYHDLLDDVEARPKSEITNVQLVKGSTIYDYEPYKSQSLSLPTPNGLPGIPVTSGGNYTDANGQQWVCDTIEWDRVSGQREYVQRVGKKSVFDCAEVGFVNGDENVVANRAIFAVEKNNSLGNFYPVYCDKFKYSEINDFNKAEPYLCTLRTATNADWSYTSRLYLFVPKTTTSFDELRELLNGECNFIHELATPIRTPLTADQIKALESLHTFSPTSIISNDQGADMQVIYVADTKAYIDSKIDALSKTILDAVGGK